MSTKRVSGFIFATLLASSASLAAAADFVDARAAPAATAAAKPDPMASKIQLQSLQQQVIMVNRFADRFQADAAAQFGAGFNAIDWKRQFGARMMHEPANALASALTARDLSSAQTELARAASVAPKHLSDAGNVINFLPSPCRIVDTRFGGGGQLGPAFRLWYATNTPAVIAGQGGNAAGCGTFPDANLFFLYVTVVPPGAPLSGGANFLTVQHDTSGPTTSTMNYYPGVNLANFAITACFGCGGGTGGFYAYASGNTHVVVDIVGWGGTVAPAALQTLNRTGQVDILNANNGSVCTAGCAAGYTLTGGGCDWGAGFNGNGKSITETGAAGAGNNGWCCSALNNAGATRTLFATAYCSRAPGT